MTQCVKNVEKMWTLSLPASLCLGVLLLSSCGSDPVPEPEFSFEIHAHRGGMALRPENTISAFRNAISVVGVDAVELDVRPTADRELVVHHDPRINPKLCADSGGK